MKKILLIDDETEILDIMTEFLSPQYETIKAYSAQEALAVIGQTIPDLIVLDINMPGMDGIELCKKIRSLASTQEIPIIFSTGYTGTDVCVKAYEVGADDFITKPFESRELVARIQAKLRKAKPMVLTDEIICGKIRLLPKSMQLFVENKESKLTKVEFELIHYFLKHLNTIIDRKKLLSDLWLGTVVSQRTIDTHIANIRKKIGEENFPLETIYGVGYIFKKS